MSRLPCRQAGAEPDDWFAGRGTAAYQRAVDGCTVCPLMLQCQELALVTGIPEGIFGGLDRQDRKVLWRRNGGRPTHFDQAIDDQLRPMLQARRDSDESARELFPPRTDPAAA